MLIPKEVKETLELSGYNSKELQKEIDHYKAAGDKLKLKAYYFLIGNMNTHYFSLVIYHSNGNEERLIYI